MTSIHATIPPNLEEAAFAAQRRGEAPGAALPEQNKQRSNLKGKSTSSSSVVMKRLPERLTSSQSAPTPRPASAGSESAEDEDEASASKENDPTLSPTAVPSQSPRRPNVTKRPLSDLPCPTEEELDQVCPSPSEQNITNNILVRRAETSTAVRSTETNVTERSLRDASTNVTISRQDGVEMGRSAKRVCSDEAKENAREEYGVSTFALSSNSSLKSASAKVQPIPVRKASAPGILSTGASKGSKARVGLRRL